MFAQVAQVSWHLPGRLRGLRWVRGICRGVCAGCAGLAAFAGAFAQVAQVSRHLPGRLRRLRKSHGICRGVCAGCASLTAFAGAFARVALGLTAFAGAFARVALGLTAFTGAAGKKCAEVRDCLRRTLVSVEAEERFPERLKETSMNEFSPDKSANILSLMENFPERYKTQCFPKSKTLFSYMTEGISHFRLLLSPVI